MAVKFRYISIKIIVGVEIYVMWIQRQLSHTHPCEQKFRLTHYVDLPAESCSEQLVDILYQHDKIRWYSN